MAGELARRDEGQRQESLVSRLQRLIPYFDLYEEAELVDDGMDGSYSGVTPDQGRYFANRLARSVLADTAHFGGVDPTSQAGQELAALVVELEPGAEVAAAQWAEQASA